MHRSRYNIYFKLILEKMKTLLKFFGILAITFGAISLYFIGFSISTTIQTDGSFNFHETANKIYEALSIRAGLYSFSFVILAFWATLKQIQLNQENNKLTLQQLDSTQNEIIEKRNSEEKQETLKQCQIYFQDIQPLYNNFVEKYLQIDTPTIWDSLDKKYTRSMLKENYEGQFSILKDMEIPIQNHILLVLYKIEAFSSLFNHGNLDKQLAHRIIGRMFVIQIGSILGLISYFRGANNSIFGQNTIALYEYFEAEELKIDPHFLKEI
jgi:hypothetical protein